MHEIGEIGEMLSSGTADLGISPKTAVTSCAFQPRSNGDNTVVYIREVYDAVLYSVYTDD